MSESLFSPGIDPPSPTLAARLRELADYLAAPKAGRLTEEQRALSLGIARRMVAEVAARLDPSVDPAALWNEWLGGGLPSATRLAGICFARAEEHRWREQSAQRGSPPPLLADPAAANDEGPAVEDALSDLDRAYLAVQIADLDSEIFRTLLLDIAAWRLAEVSKDAKRAAALGDAVRAATERQAKESGIEDAGGAYYAALGADATDAAAAAIARHDWPVLIALAAAAHRRSYDGMALALLTAESAALPSLFAPLRLDNMALAPIEASLAMLPARAVGSADDMKSYDADRAR